MSENYYEFAIEDWNKDKSSHNSSFFKIGDYEWRIYVYPNENNFLKFELYLYSSLKDTEYINANCVFFIRNSNGISFYKAKEYSPKCLNEKNDEIVFNNFIKAEELIINNEYSNRPLIENNKVVVGVYLRLYKDKVLININNTSKLIVYDEEIAEVNSQSGEKKISVTDFLKMSENETQKYDSVVFYKVRINNNFAINYIWKLKDSVDLTFNNCICVDGTTYKDLFASTDVSNLRMISCGLTNDEAIYIVCNLYPYTLNSVTFTNEKLDKELLVNTIFQNSSLSRDILILN
ncbi:hypothetical protein PIROE2DRAFT_61099 [Piromyces sp. E2]|nr:hypothetical protein PIROE2DRAFT_61099 [Piromyces sp. E2]|eukprot:OUM63720.1 hypothetical protein PIROE2DRAFT_61099 [Piromyces sp. E2]